MAYSLTVPEGYGYVLLVALGAIPLLSTAQGVAVTELRRPAQVPYPNCYATAQQIKESKEAYKFNCAQRAHGNLLENMPQTMIMMLFAGLQYPMLTAGLGAGWVLSRALYAYGYITSSKPNGSGRMIGGAFWLCQGGIWASCVGTALKML